MVHIATLITLAGIFIFIFGALCFVLPQIIQTTRLKAAGICGIAVLMFIVSGILMPPPDPEAVAAQEAEMALLEKERAAERIRLDQEREAEQARLAQERAEAEAEAERLAAKEESACRQDLQCWGDKHSIAASVRCPPVIEAQILYAHEWTDGWLDSKFDRFGWRNLDTGELRYLGNKLRVQNAFGAMRNVSYTCYYNPDTETVTSVEIN